jgi:hypothetical protein
MVVAGSVLGRQGASSLQNRRPPRTGGLPQSVIYDAREQIRPVQAIADSLASYPWPVSEIRLMKHKLCGQSGRDRLPDLLWYQVND